MQPRAAAALLLCLVVAAGRTAPAAAARPAVSPMMSGVEGAGQRVDAPAPWFCHNLDCPRFTVIESTDEYELRHYEAGTWVATDVESYAYALAVRTGFQRLFQYIDGANHDATKIPMTTPVVTAISTAAGPFCNNNFTISFFVPFALQAKGPPKPNNPDLYIKEAPPVTVYVAVSGGFVLDDYSISHMAKRLTNALDAAGLPYLNNSFYMAGYDPPLRLAGRHNEVMVLKEWNPDHQATQ